MVAQVIKLPPDLPQPVLGSAKIRPEKDEMAELAEERRQLELERQKLRAEQERLKQELSRPTPSPKPRQDHNTFPSAFQRVDRSLETMEWGNIAFNTPTSMNLEDKARIQLLLGLELAHPIEELSQGLKAELENEGINEGIMPHIESARVKVSERVEARLSGSDFEIKPITVAARQPSASGSPTAAGSGSRFVTKV